jgi:hypothetical protein
LSKPLDQKNKIELEAGNRVGLSDPPPTEKRVPIISV